MIKAVICVILLVNLSAYAADEVAVTTAENQIGVLAAPATTAEAAPVKAQPSEDQIPLNITVDKKPVEAGGSSTRILFTGFVIATLLGTAYYFVRKYKTSNKINKSNMQIKVLSQHYLGPKKSLAIIRVSGESILIGVTDTNISMIKSLSLIDDEVPAEAPQSFAGTLEKENSQSGAGARSAMADELDEEFSFSGVKDSVSKKIKSMRSFS